MSAVNQSGKQGHRIQLEHGSVEAIIPNQPTDRPFVFVTPHAEATVLGTTLRIVAEDRFTRLDVIAGKVRFRRLSDGTEIIVSAGEYASVAPNVPLAARPIADEPPRVQ